jgi:hypothetical protein
MICLRLFRAMFLVMVLFATASIVAAQAPEPDVIVVDVESEPYGIEYDAAADRFLLAPISGGVIYAVDDDGTLTPFIDLAPLKERLGGADMLKIGGIHIDEPRNRLLIVVTSRVSAVEFENGLVIHDLASGEELSFVDLTAMGEERGCWVQDVTVDNAGNAYVTDSFGGVVFEVDPDGHVSVFAEDKRWAWQPTRNSRHGIKGIVIHPDGYLIVDTCARGEFFKIPLDDPAMVTEVELDQDIVQCASGMVLDGSGDLIAPIVGFHTVVANTVVLHSDDEWASAQTVVEFTGCGGDSVNVALRQNVPFLLCDPGAPVYWELMPLVIENAD